MIVKKRMFFFYLVLILSCNSHVEYYTLPTFSSNNTLNSVIEIPAGTNKKYEYNKTTNRFEIDQKNGKDRVVDFLPYIGNYGYIPSTYSDPKKGGDGDALDVLVLSESMPTGSISEILPIAMLKLIDDGELDYKIIAIPFNESDQIIKATTYKELDESYPQIKQIIELWFLNYNKDDEARIDGWVNEKEAIKEINSNLL
jgi:inorganic pyrophosphatase